MHDLGELKTAVAAYLRADAGFSDIRITPEYPSARDYPLKKPVVAVGIDSAELRGGLGGYLGIGDSGALYGTECLITMRFDIFAPEGGEDPHAVMERLFGALMITQNSFGFSKLWSGAAAWDKNAGALKLSVKGSLGAALSRSEDDGGVSGVIIIAKPL